MSAINLNASARIMYEAAQQRGVECELFGDKQTILMTWKGRQWYTRGSRISSQSSVGKSIADNKYLTKIILNHFGLPTARAELVKKKEDLTKLGNINFPMVMKPTDGRYGQGVVVGIAKVAAAEKAYEKVGGTVLFEEELVGKEYRIVCVDFKFVAAAYRMPAHVVGDGGQSIEQLVTEKNKHPWRMAGHKGNLSLIVIDKVVKDYLLVQGLKLESVPTKGVKVWLRRTANLSTGGEAYDVTDEVGSENRKFFEIIAKACDLKVIGIDLMCDSLVVPINKQARAGVIEVNASPGLRMHHYPISGKPRNIAGKILDLEMK